MSRFSLGVLAVVGIIATAVWALSPAVAEAKGKNKADKEKHIHGRVVSVSTGRDGSGSITIATHAKKGKKGAAANNKAKSETKTVQVGPQTVYAAVSNAGKMRVTLAALHKGEKVTISAANGPADEVDIAVRHKQHKHKKGVVAVG